jgi:hypothetical protein
MNHRIVIDETLTHGRPVDIRDNMRGASAKYGFAVAGALSPTIDEEQRRRPNSFSEAELQHVADWHTNPQSCIRDRASALVPPRPASELAELRTDEDTQDEDLIALTASQADR